MNQKESRIDDIHAETLADLPLSGKQAEDTKAGAGDVGYLGPPTAPPKIGGVGRDILLGGSGDDVLIGGTTSY